MSKTHSHATWLLSAVLWLPLASQAQPPGAPGTAPFGPFSAPSGPAGQPARGRPEPGQRLGVASRLAMEQRTTPTDYWLRIGLEHLDPSQVSVRIAGQGLLVRFSDLREQYREGTPADRGARWQAYRFSSGTMSRRLPLPPDADPSRIARAVTESEILIRIPRLAPVGR